MVFKNSDFDYCIKCKGNFFRLNSTDPAYQYQTQKIIQNTVRVPSSLYSMNLGALASYQPVVASAEPNPNIPNVVPVGSYIGVPWNQMSDRSNPHVQTGSGGSQGSTYHLSSLKRTQTRCRPGAGTPGGVGVDIKHNSYARRFNRLKGGKLLRRGPVPCNYGAPIPFTCAAPIYGGKTVKTSIVSNCSRCICPENDKHVNPCNYPCELTCRQNESFELQSLYKTLSNCNDCNGFNIITYKIGQTVYALDKYSGYYLRAIVIQIISPNVYVVEFDNQATATVTSSNGEIIPYFPCNCSENEIQNVLTTGVKIFGLCSLSNLLNATDYSELVGSLKSLNFQYSYFPNYVNQYLAFLKNQSYQNFDASNFN